MEKAINNKYQLDNMGTLRKSSSAMKCFVFVLYRLMGIISLYQDADTSFNPRMPARIKPTMKNLMMVAGSPKTAIPIRNVPAAPIPVQIA